MTQRCTASVASVLAVALSSIVLVGCGPDDGEGSTQGDSAGTASPTASSSAPLVGGGAADSTESADGSASPDASSATPSSTDTESGGACVDTAPQTIPDGRWTGPITLHVDATVDSGGSVSGSGKPGASTMTVTVKNGKIVKGGYTLVGHGTSEGTDGGADLDIVVTGSVTGLASQPQLNGSAAVHGTAHATAGGGSVTVPVDLEGIPGEPVPMTIEESSCSGVTGTFLPELKSKYAQIGQILDGSEATWTGHYVG